MGDSVIRTHINYCHEVELTKSVHVDPFLGNLLYMKFKKMRITSMTSQLKKYMYTREEEILIYFKSFFMVQ